MLAIPTPAIESTGLVQGEGDRLAALWHLPAKNFGDSSSDPGFYL
jgi:hypothetical protein